MLGFLLLASICGKQGLRFRLEPARLVELRLDAFPPVVDALEQELVHPEITEHADEDDKGDRDPELGFKHWLPQRLSALLTASATSSPAIAHCRQPLLGNRLFRFGDMGMEFRVHLLATGFGCCGCLCARLVRERLRPSAGLR